MSAAATPTSSSQLRPRIVSAPGLAQRTRSSTPKSSIAWSVACSSSTESNLSTCGVRSEPASGLVDFIGCLSNGRASPPFLGIGIAVGVSGERIDLRGGENVMQSKELEDVIRRVEIVEDDVFRFIEDNPQVIKSKGTVEILKRLKSALASLRAVRGNMAGMEAADVPPREHLQYRILRKPH